MSTLCGTVEPQKSTVSICDGFKLIRCPASNWESALVLMGKAEIYCKAF